MDSISLVIPALNEEKRIVKNLLEICSFLDNIDNLEYEIIVVDDGSTDSTSREVNEIGTTHQNIKLLSLNRNFGKEAAMHAGLVNSTKFDAVIVMDSDLQHPPSFIPEMIDRWRQGFKVINAVKSGRGSEGVSKSVLVKFYYWLFRNFTPLDVELDSDFKLLDQVVVRSYTELIEHNKFFRGLVRWMDYSSDTIYFRVPEVNDKLQSSWKSANLLRYGISSITSFSSLPLQIITFLGLTTMVISLIIGGLAIYDKLAGNAVDGFTTVILLILIIGSILMISVGLIGVYIGKIYDEIKRRPSYLIDYQKSNIFK